jgi:hypothetical protein
MTEGGGHAPQRLRAHPGSGRGLLLGSFTFRGGGRSTRSPATNAPVRFPDDAGALTGSSSRRRAEKSNPTPYGAHSLAARPGALAGSLSISSLEASAGFEPASPALQAGT